MTLFAKYALGVSYHVEMSGTENSREYQSGVETINLSIIVKIIVDVKGESINVALCMKEKIDISHALVTGSCIIMMNDPFNFS